MELIDRPGFFHHQLQWDWNTNRLNKLIAILGREWFAGKKILEVGSGHGAIGAVLISLGAHVIFTDARAAHVEYLKGCGYEAYVMDQDSMWTVPGPFDLIIHWGVSYHLNHWQQDLLCAINSTTLLCFETEVADNPSPEFELKVQEIDHYDQAFNRIGTLLSPARIEAFVSSHGASFTRFDDRDLDTGGRAKYYSWKAGETTTDDAIGRRLRRFWIIKR